MKRAFSWMGCWWDVVRSKLLFFKEGLPIPRRKCHSCRQDFFCMKCHHMIDFEKTPKTIRGQQVSWSCPRCGYESKNFQCPNCKCFTPESVGRCEDKWTCSTCLMEHRLEK